MATPYQVVAKAALINWNGLSEEEATIKIQNESVQELEKQVYAIGTIKYAVIGIAKEVDLSEKEAIKFFDGVINGPEDAKIFQIVTSKVQGMTDGQKLSILSTIHDGWVVDNSSEKKFNKKVAKQQLRQYAPLELIGWNEVKSDLLFLTPVLASVGVHIDEKKLSQVYHTKVANYMEIMQINNQNDITALIKQGRNYYPALSEKLDSRLSPMSEVVSEQIVQNWNTKDLETAQIFASRQQSKSTGENKKINNCMLNRPLPHGTYNHIG